MSFFRSKQRLIAGMVLFVFLFPLPLAASAPLIDLDVPAEEPRSVEYTEDLLEITDQGYFDAEGNYIPQLELEEEIPQPPSLPDISQVTELEGREAANELDAYRQSLIESWGGKKVFTEIRLQGTRENLIQQEARFRELEQEIESVEEKLAPLREKALTLKGQIDLINGQIRITKEKIKNVETLIAEKQVQLKDLLLGLRRSEIELKIQEKVVMDYVRLLYQEEEEYLSLNQEEANTLKLLLADASVSENLLGKDYLAVMEQTGRDVFYDLERKRRELSEQKEKVSVEREELQFLHEVLSRERLTLEETRLSKKELLEETQGEEEEYRFLLEQAIQEQLETAIAIQNLQENINLIEGKLDLLEEGLEEVDEAEPELDLEAVDEQIQLMDSVTGDAREIVLPDLPEKRPGKPFIWPVPANKITAKFHDESYPKRWGDHNAIDIRARQFTAIVAPANGYVFQTKDNGKGYSYIILAHKNNLITVYGHVSEIVARPGTVVKQGELIGYSGGTPGTKGAGLQTTGPHLHFEVHKKGQPVNPLDFLPLEELPLEYVPDEYLQDLK